MGPVELRQIRQGLIEQAKAILDKAEQEKRDLTSDERARYDALMASVEIHNREIERTEESEQRVLEAARRGENVVPTLGMATPPDGVRALRANERITDYLAREQRDMLPEGLQSDNLSLGRVIRGIVTGDWRGAEAERRAMGVGSDSLGGFLVPQPLAARVIDLSRAQTAVIRAGALTVPMEASTLKLAKILTDPTAGWKAENAAIAEGDMTFGQVELKAHTLAAMVRVSVELIEDAQNLGPIVEAALSQALALELDKAALLGTGLNEQPLGLYNAPGVAKYTMGDNGAALTDYRPFSVAVEQVRQANGEPNALIWAPRTAGEAERLKDSTGQPLQPPASFQALQKLSTSQIPVNLTKGTATNATFAVVGDFRQLLIGTRTQLTLEVSREASDAFGKLQTLIRAYLRADVAVLKPEHFSIIDGIVPPAE